MTSHATGILDATATECLLAARAPLDAHAAAALVDLVGLPGARSAVPVVAPDHPLHAALFPLIDHAQVLEPLDAAAHRWLQTSGHGSGAIVADPVGVLLSDANADAPAADGPAADADPGTADRLVRERTVWLEAPAGNGTSGRGAASAFVDDLLVWLDHFASATSQQRVRIRDPDGHLRPDTIEPVLAHAAAPRLTLSLEDRHGLALATAHRALHGTRAASGPTIRSSLLGIGPRTGIPATELLVSDPQALKVPAEHAALLAGEPLSPRHPHWGDRRNEILEPERIRTSADIDRTRWTPATLPALLAHHLKAFGLDDDPGSVQRLTALLAARLRPGERLDGPTLYAFLATHHDLRDAATRTKEPS